MASSLRLLLPWKRATDASNGPEGLEYLSAGRESQAPVLKVVEVQPRYYISSLEAPAQRLPGAATGVSRTLCTGPSTFGKTNAGCARTTRLLLLRQISHNLSLKCIPGRLAGRPCCRPPRLRRDCPVITPCNKVAYNPSLLEVEWSRFRVSDDGRGPGVRRKKPLAEALALRYQGFTTRPNFRDYLPFKKGETNPPSCFSGGQFISARSLVRIQSLPPPMYARSRPQTVI